MTVLAIKLLRPDARMPLAVLHSVRRLIQDCGVKGEGGPRQAAHTITIDTPSLDQYDR